MAEVTRKVKGGLLVGDIESVKVAEESATDTPSKRTRKSKEVKTED